MSVSFSLSHLSISIPSSESSLAPSISNSLSLPRFPPVTDPPANNIQSLRVRASPLPLRGGGGAAANFCHKFYGFKLRILKKLNIWQPNRKHGSKDEIKSIRNRDKDQVENPSKNVANANANANANDEQFSEAASTLSLPNDSTEDYARATSQPNQSSLPTSQTGISKQPGISLASPPSFMKADDHKRGPSLAIAVIGATGELATKKIFPALFALYYSGFLPENVGIFGYSRKNLTDEDLRSLIASTLTCRIDHQKNCDEKMDAFLSRTYYLNGGYDNKEGMSKLNALMEQIEGGYHANRIFYLSVPQEALLDVASSLANNAQTEKGWNRIIIEKPFGFDAQSSQWFTKSLLSKFEENQIYRIDHLLGRNLIENLTVLRFSNLVFEPLWSRTYIRNVQVILSEDLSMQTGRYFDGYGVIRDIVHSHMLQTIALLAMEPPISLDGEDIRNEKVKVLRSIRKLEPSDVILGQYKATSGDKVDVSLSSLTPTYFAAALYIDNARWDGVPFLIKAGVGLIKHRVEIRIQFDHVPGNLYRERIGHNTDRATNELILRNVPDEAILVKINNKIPGLGLQLDASELNLLYKDKYNVEVPDSYEQLLLDVIDGDNHLFLRSDELAAAWSILNPILQQIDQNNIAPELYELGGRGPVGAYYLWAKHGVRWADD